MVPPVSCCLGLPVSTARGLYPDPVGNSLPALPAGNCLGMWTSRVSLERLLLSNPMRGLVSHDLSDLTIFFEVRTQIFKD